MSERDEERKIAKILRVTSTQVSEEVIMNEMMQR
jgi:hypothetical protein